MKASLLITLFFLFSVHLAFSQDEEANQNAEQDTTELWETSGSLNATFANVGLSNWAGGGESSIALGTILNFNAKRSTEKTVWESILIAQFGLTRVGDGDYNLFKKTDDNFQLDSRYSYKFDERWSSSTSLNFRTQMAPGYTFKRDSLGVEERDELISEFLAPGYLLLATGIQYNTKIFSVRYSPLAAKFTLVMNDALAAQGAFGVDEGENIRSEFGSNLDATLQYDLMENVKFLSTLNLFANYQEFSHIDVNWENLINFKINKYFTTSFSTQLIYDHDVLIPQEDGTDERAIQFKHVLNINFGYNF